MADTTTTTTTTPTMPATTFTPLPGYGYGYQGSDTTMPPQTTRHGSGSIGAFFAVLAAVLVLTLLSCVFGRVCAGYAEGPDEQYDCVRLARRWCGPRAPSRSAVNKREAKPPPPAVVVEVVPTALPPPPEEP